MSVAVLNSPNRLLAALPPAQWARWQPALESIDLPLGKVLYEPGARMPQLVFPSTAIVSLVYGLEDGGSAEIAMVGREGLVGLALVLGGETTPSCAVVQSAGRALRLRPELLLAEFEHGGPVQQLLLRYTQALLTQVAQTAVCNRHHTVDQQLCRWLLSSLDRLDGRELVTTQELIAHMLGVRREGVAEAAKRLHQAGLIEQRRGRITVLDRVGLERRSCECYAVVRKEYDRLLAQRAAP